MKRRLRRGLEKAQKPAGVLRRVDWSADPPLVHYSLDGGNTYRIASVPEFERATGCKLSFSEPQA